MYDGRSIFLQECYLPRNIVKKRKKVLKAAAKIYSDTAKGT